MWLPNFMWVNLNPSQLLTNKASLFWQKFWIAGPTPALKYLLHVSLRIFISYTTCLLSLEFQPAPSSAALVTSTEKQGLVKLCRWFGLRTRCCLGTRLRAGVNLVATYILYWCWCCVFNKICCYNACQETIIKLQIYTKPNNTMMKCYSISLKRIGTTWGWVIRQLLKFAHILDCRWYRLFVRVDKGEWCTISTHTCWLWLFLAYSATKAVYS